MRGKERLNRVNDIRKNHYFLCNFGYQMILSLPLVQRVLNPIALQNVVRRRFSYFGRLNIFFLSMVTRRT